MFAVIRAGVKGTGMRAFRKMTARQMRRWWTNPTSVAWVWWVGWAR